MNPRLRPVDLIDDDAEMSVVTLERFERRLSEECGSLRLAIAEVRSDVRGDIKDLRAEMMDRNNSMLRWLLGFFLAQTTAIGAIFAALR